MQVGIGTSNVWAIAVAFLAVIVLIRALLIGSASIDGQSLTREKEPTIYWLIIIANIVIVIGLLWIGFN